MARITFAVAANRIINEKVLHFPNIINSIDTRNLESIALQVLEQGRGRTYENKKCQEEKKIRHNLASSDVNFRLHLFDQTGEVWTAPPARNEDCTHKLTEIDFAVFQGES